jgi:divalent metal cation (Fe/Co/Zn/Cd) transporter
MPPMTNEQQGLETTAQRLEYATIGWNVVEMLITIALGVAAKSLALVAFGLDTMVELFASGVVLWHLRHDSRHTGRVTARALRMVAAAFAVLAVVVATGAIWALVTQSVPDDSPWGIAYIAVTVLAMLALGLAKRATGKRLGSEPVMAEARMSVLDSALAFGVLLGLAGNAAFGWWWADPIAAILVAIAALNETRENLEEARELEER